MNTLLVVTLCQHIGNCSHRYVRVRVTSKHRFVIEDLFKVLSIHICKIQFELPFGNLGILCIIYDKAIVSSYVLLQSGVVIVLDWCSYHAPGPCIGKLQRIKAVDLDTVEQDRRINGGSTACYLRKIVPLQHHTPRILEVFIYSINYRMWCTPIKYPLDLCKVSCLKKELNLLNKLLHIDLLKTAGKRFTHYSIKLFKSDWILISIVIVFEYVNCISVNLRMNPLE